KVAAVKPGGAGVAVETDAGTLEAEQVLMAVGRAAKVTGLGLEPLGVRLDRGFVTVSPRMETSVPGVYAIGDMAGPPLLAHKAMAEGVVAAEAISGRDPRPLDHANVPSCTYCRPQIASVGLTEAKARENGREVSVGQLTPFDLVVLLIISNVVQNAVIGPDNSLGGGLLGAAVILGLNYVVVELTFRSKRLRRLIEATPTLLIHNGHILYANLRKERV